QAPDLDIDRSLQLGRPSLDMGEESGQIRSQVDGVRLQPVEYGVREDPAAQGRVVLRDLAGGGRAQGELLDTTPANRGEVGDRGPRRVVMVLQESRACVEEQHLLSEAVQIVALEVLKQVGCIDAALVVRG